MTKKQWLKRFFILRRHLAKVSLALNHASCDLYTEPMGERVWSKKDHLEVTLRHLKASVMLAYEESGHPKVKRP